LKHPALHGSGVSDPPPRKIIQETHKFLMTEPGLINYCYQELFLKYKECEKKLYNANLNNDTSA